MEPTARGQVTTPLKKQNRKQSVVNSTDDDCDDRVERLRKNQQELQLVSRRLVFIASALGNQSRSRSIFGDVSRQERLERTTPGPPHLDADLQDLMICCLHQARLYLERGQMVR